MNRRLDEKICDLVKATHELAEDGEGASDDFACLSFFGVMRDCAFQLEQQLSIWRKASVGSGVDE
jgi:hypothetical protein